MTADPLDSDCFLEHLRQDLRDQLPDRSWRAALAPSLSYGRHAGPAPKDARRAAVAILVCRDDSGWSIPLTVRSEQLKRHGGEVSFPGGLLESDETAHQAAAREVAEELGLSPDVNWLGELAPLYVYASGNVVTPCVGAVSGWPCWQCNPDEVAEVIRLPVQMLLSQTPTTTAVQRGPLHFSAPCYKVSGHVIWGSTAVLLGEIRGRLRRVARYYEP